MKYTVILLIILGSITVVNAQNKVKGNRKVIEVSERLDSFSKIKVTDGLEVTLMKSLSEGYNLEMDENLVELINMDVTDSLLVVSLQKTIRSSKKLNITIRYTELTEIEVDAKARVTAQSAIEAVSFKGIISGNGFLQGEIRAEEADFLINDNSKLELGYKGNKLTINATNNAFLRGDVDTEVFTLDGSGRSDFDLVGNAIEAVLTLSDNAEFKASTFYPDTVRALLRDSSEATVNADQNIIIDMSDRSTLNLYGEPLLTIERFSGTSKIQKRE